MVKLSIITITYNNEDSVGTFLSSLLKNLPDRTEVIILDNHSTDNTLNFLEKSQIKLISSKKNLGFSQGNNLAVTYAKGEYLMFLNPDTEIRKNIFGTLMDYLYNHPEVGIVAPRLITPNGKVQPSIRRLPTVMGAVKEYVFKIKGSYEPYIPDGNLPVEADSVYGAAMMLSKKLFVQLGGFDERFFMYFEDLDLCRRVSKIKKIVYLPDISIIHRVGGSHNPRKLAWIKKSEKIYHGLIPALLISLIGRIGNKINSQKILDTK